MTAFANSVIERYQNPYIRHELMSIALNSTTKFKTRLLPTLTDYVKLTGKLPEHLLFSLAALILFHKGKRGAEDIKLADDPAYLAKWKEVWAEFDGDYTALEKRTADFAKSLADILRGKGVDVQMPTIASMFSPFFCSTPVANFAEAQKSDQKIFASFYKQMRMRGIYLAPSGFETGMTSFAHTDEDFARALEAASSLDFGK